MKKIGLCVVTNNNNFGSMLQSYATMKTLENMGYDYDIIRYKKKYTPMFILKSIPRIFNPITISDKKLIIQKKILMMFHKDVKVLNANRNKMFDKFRKEHFLKFSPIAYGYEELMKLGIKYDAYLVGSDQLWSPSGLATNFYNLNFVNDSKLKISYASSFGVKEIPSYQIEKTQKYLNRIDFISTRENSGKIIVKELTNKEVPVVVDPTLLFNDIEWNDILKDEKLYEEEYIFSYFLGPNAKHREIVKKLAKETGLKIVTIRHMDQYVEADNNYGDYFPYEVGPQEFVNLIRHAKYICTDSFHGAVFSIINHKQFIVFNRYADEAKDSKNSRIDSLCTNLGLENRRFKSNILEEMKKEINYKQVNSKLDVMRENSKRYLTDALSKIE